LIFLETENGKTEEKIVKKMRKYNYF